MYFKRVTYQYGGCLCFFNTMKVLTNQHKEMLN